MSRKKCRRKVYPSGGDLVTAVIRRASFVGDQQLAQLRDCENGVLDALRTGTGTPDEWRVMADISNVAQTMALSGIGPEVLEVCAQAESHLAEMKERFDKTGKLGLTGPALQCFRDLLEFHDLQRTAIPLGEYQRMVEKTSNRIRSGHPTLKIMGSAC